MRCKNDTDIQRLQTHVHILRQTIPHAREMIIAVETKPVLV